MDDHYVPTARPKRCCVKTCSNRDSKRHRFPKNNMEVCNIWIELSNYETLSVEEINKIYVVCEEQFDPKCIIQSRSGIKLNAVLIFRLNKEMVRDLIETVTPFVQAPIARPHLGLSVEVKVLAALRFYASGSYQEVTGSNIYVGMSQPSVSRSIEEITNALNRNEIVNRWIKFPQNLEELKNLRRRFYEKFHVPGVVGVINCTHIAIVTPQGDPEHPEHIYINRKNYHSINCQLVCDDNLKILHVNPKFPGSSHDAYIWQNSNISDVMERIYRHNPNDPYFLIGDSGYPLRPWLLTPLQEEIVPNSPEDRFDRAFKTNRSIIERCNGLLKSRFRCLIKDRTLHYHPVKAAKIVKACTVLHNMCITAGFQQDLEIDEGIQHEGMYINAAFHGQNNLEGRINPDLIQARELQRNIIDNHFHN